MRRRNLTRLIAMHRAPLSPDAEYYSSVPARDDALARARPPMKIYKAEGVTLTIDGHEYDFDAINYAEKMGVERREPSPEKYEMTITMLMHNPTTTHACGACGGPWDDAHRALESCLGLNPNRLAP